jgi:hypothetical protein
MANDTAYNEYLNSLSPEEREAEMLGQQKAMAEYNEAVNAPQSTIPLVQGDLNATDVIEDVGTNSTTTSVEPTVLNNPNGIVDKSDLETTSTTLPPMGEGTPQGVFSTPRAGSRVWIFFHGGDIQRPVYFAQSIPPTEYQNYYANPVPQPGDNNSSEPPVVIDPTNGNESVIPATRSAIPNTAPSSENNLTPEQLRDKVDADAAAELPTQTPTSSSGGLNQVKTDPETGITNWTLSLK